MAAGWAFSRLLISSASSCVSNGENAQGKFRLSSWGETLVSGALIWMRTAQESGFPNRNADPHSLLRTTVEIRRYHSLRIAARPRSAPPHVGRFAHLSWGELSRSYS